MKKFIEFVNEAKLVSNKDGSSRSKVTSFASSEPNSYHIVDNRGGHIGSASQLKDPAFNFKTTHWHVTWHSDDHKHRPTSFQYIKQLKDHIKSINEDCELVEKVKEPTGELKDACWKGYTAIGKKMKNGKEVPNCVPVKEESAAWQRKEGKNPTGGLNKKGVESYRRENPGSKLQTAVTTPPSKLDPDSKAAKRRKSFCARMSGMPGPMKDEKGKPTRKALSLRKWNC